MRAPLITTVLPTFRRAPLLARAVRSVLAQSFADFEVHIYDNASGDETSRVACELASSDRRVRYHCHRTNIGAVANFEYSLERVATPYFNILSDDDYLLPDFFATALHELESHPEPMVFAGRLAHVDQHGRLLAVPLKDWAPGCYRPPAAALKWISRGDTWTSLLFRRECLLLVGNIDNSIGLEADFDFLLRVLLKAPLLVKDEICACFTIHGDSAMSQGSLGELIAGMRKMEQKCEARNDLSPALVQRLSRALRASNARRLFRLSMKLASRGACADLQTVIKELRASYAQPGPARILELAAASGWGGALTRRAFSSLYQLRRTFRKMRFGPEFPLVLSHEDVSLAETVRPRISRAAQVGSID